MDAGSSSIRPEDKKRKAQGPPESARPHGAKQSTASARYTLGKARSVDVVGFVEARAFEINALQRSLENARSAGNTRAFQTLPRHLRRRAASHNVKRLPARLREKALAEMKKSAQTSKALAGTDRLTNAQTSSRYKRRRARATREEYELRQAGKRWLETHVWHAKRMRMKELWGTMVAETPNERSHRAAYRAAKEKTYIQDVSYFNTLELTGSEEAIVDVLRPLLPPDGMTILMKPYATGARMAPLTLYRAGMYPLAALGPAMALWQPVSSTEQRKLWLRVHPANANAVKAELEQAVEDRSQLEDQSVRIADITCDLVSFELLGGQSTQLLATVLAQSTDLGACGASVLQLIRALPNPAVLPESVVIALQIHDPRLEFPFKADPAHASLSADEQQRLHEILLRWPVDAAILDRQQPSAGIWDREECAKSLARRQSEQALNQRRKQQLIPGMKLKPDPSIDVAVPLLLVRTGPEAQLGSRTGRMDRQYIDTLAHGWTLVAPRGWGMPLWMALNFAGARAQGLNECHHVGFEAGLPTFPANWPGTSAYNAWDGAAATAAYQKWMRRPPGKRVNYLKFGIESPFYAPFRQLLGLPGMPEAYPRISADDLECRMKRLRKVASKKKEAKANGQTSAGCALDSSFPAPPDYYSAFTDANVQRLAEVDCKAELDDPELKLLVPPPPPQSGTYSSFGRVWHVHDRLPTLAEQNIPQLYPEGPVDRVAELKRLNRSVIFEFLDLVDVLVKDPSQYTARTDRIRDVFVNIHHLINEYREHQAKETLKLMIQQQIDGKRQTTERILSKCQELEQTIERVKLEAADTGTELTAAIAGDADQADGTTHADTGQPERTHTVPDDGLARIIDAVHNLT
ncbi:Ribonucleases P/MRP protein subunit pop1 [Coemansia sp. RSA 2708]|nr:Ribonucleases P/MRP protein subunit pop1 [Coemansia sp. RSA 2708]